MKATSWQLRAPRYIIEAAREDEYMIRFGSIRARRPLAKLTAAQRRELLLTATRQLAVLSEQLGEEIALLDEERLAL